MHTIVATRNNVMAVTGLEQKKKKQVCPCAGIQCGSNKSRDDDVRLQNVLAVSRLREISDRVIYILYTRVCVCIYIYIQSRTFEYVQTNSWVTEETLFSSRLEKQKKKKKSPKTRLLWLTYISIHMMWCGGIRGVM